MPMPTNSANSLLPPSSTYGLPEQYDSWRPHQPEAIISTCESDRPVSCIVAPTGFGKTITGATIAKFMGGRYCYMVETKNLMSQIYDRDLQGVFFKIWGKNNYDCKLLTENGFKGYLAKCDKAGSMCGSCVYKDGGCYYYDAVRRASIEDADLTNYSFWLAANRYIEGGIGRFDTLIMDEAHSAPDAVTKAMRVEITEVQCEKFFKERLPKPMPIPEWRSWARSRFVTVQAALDAARASGHDGEALDLLLFGSNLGVMSSMSSEGETMWVEDRDWKEPDTKASFEPVWPMQYRSLLFQPAKKIVLMSATVRPKTLHLLGLKPEEYDFLEYPSSFPVDRRPVIYVPCVLQRHGMSLADRIAAVQKIDTIVQRRLDRKGVIHTVSFDRAELIREYSRFAKKMIFTRRGRHLAEDLENFKASGPGTILVGPNFDEGVDLPYDDCEYQIIVKVPFPDTRSPVMKARCDLDQDYRNYVAMVTIVQMAGRGMRAADDRCECVSPDTRILTSDLRWVRAGDLSVGDGLLAFDEPRGTRLNPRRWRWSEVVKSTIRTMPRMRVVLDNADDLICTPNHPWVVYGTHRLRNYARTHIWRRTDELRPGDKLAKFANTWRDGSTFEEGWLSGILDGEGCLVLRSGSRNPNVSGVYLSQNLGPVLDQAAAFLTQQGFSFSVGKRPGKQRAIKLLGGMSELLRLLGQIRPTRLLTKFSEVDRQERFKAISSSTVLAVERLPDGPISSLQTSTETYVAEGFGAHNTFIIDDQWGNWFLRTARDFAPLWFLQACRREAFVPSPPERLWR